MESISSIKLRKDYIKELRDIDYLLGSVEVIGFIQNQDQETRQKFFDYKTNLSITRSRLERENLGAIAFYLEELSTDFKNGIDNLKNKIDGLNNTTDIFKSIDIIIDTLTRIFL